MKYEVDSYILEYLEDENKYFITFKDSVGNDCRLEICKDIFDEYMDSKKYYEKFKNEERRHIDHNDYSEEKLYWKVSNTQKSIEEIVIRTNEKQILKKALTELTEAQYKRIMLHIVSEITIRDIAKIENVRKKQIEKSLHLGINKIKKFFL